MRLMVTYRIIIYEQKLRLQMGRIGWRFSTKLLDSVHDLATRGAMGGPYSSGKLAASIYKSGPRTTGFKTNGFVGSNLDYAASVEFGASVHEIFPKGASHVWRFGDRRRPQLRFVWHGRVIYTPHVPMGPRTIGRSHPGQKGKHFLRDAMIRSAIKYRVGLGIRVFRN